MMYFLKRWKSKFKNIVVDFVTGVGLFWLVVEMASYSTNGAADTYLKSILLFGLACLGILVISLTINAPKKSFVYKLRDKDSYIEVKVGDAFSNPGSLIVPFNDCFDVSLGGNVKKAKSLQNRLISEYYSDKDEHLLNDIQQSVDISSAPFDVGKTVEVEQYGKTFYLLVNSRKKENNRVESSADDFLLSLSKVWMYIALESGRNSAVTIPLLSTNHGRITNINRVTAIKEIIDSYIDASKTYNIADKLIVSIFPDDLKKGNIDLDEIEEFLRFSCHHYTKTTFTNKIEGQEVTTSVVERLER